MTSRIPYFSSVGNFKFQTIPFPTIFYASKYIGLHYYFQVLFRSSCHYHDHWYFIVINTSGICIVRQTFEYLCFHNLCSIKVWVCSMSLKIFMFQNHIWSAPWQRTYLHCEVYMYKQALSHITASLNFGKETINDLELCCKASPEIEIGPCESFDLHSRSYSMQTLMSFLMGLSK